MKEKASLSRSVSYQFSAKFVQTLPWNQTIFQPEWIRYLANVRAANKLLEQNIENGLLGQGSGKSYHRAHGETYYIWFWGTPGKEMREFIAKLRELFPNMTTGICRDGED